MNPNIPSNLIAVKEDGDQVMGYVGWFSVPDRFVEASKLGRAWASQALPTHMIPQNRKAVDTFKNACRSIETRRQGSNRVTEVKVDQVDETHQDCVYQVTYMVRDTAQRQIEHPKGMRVTFDKSNDQISFDPLNKKYASSLPHLESAIQDHFDANSEKVPGSKVRNAVRALLDTIGAVNLRKKSGGVYFIPKTGRSELDGLAKVLDFLYSDDAELHLIPCANDKYQQDMVARHFELEVSSEIDETIARVIEKLTSSRKMRHDAVGNLFARRKELGDLRTKYAGLVNDDIATVEEKLRLLDQQLQALVEKQAS